MKPRQVKGAGIYALTLLMAVWTCLIATAVMASASPTDSSVVVCIDRRGLMTRIAPSAMCPTGSERVVLGATGPTGATGSPGPSGATGLRGPSGATGLRGGSGATGSPGPSGATGSPGPSGATGSPGPSGATGSPGISKAYISNTSYSPPTGVAGASSPFTVLHTATIDAGTYIVMMIVKIDTGSNYNLTCQLVKDATVILEDLTQTQYTRFIVKSGSTTVASTSTFKVQCQSGSGSPVSSLVVDAQLTAIKVDTVN